MDMTYPDAEQAFAAYIAARCAHQLRSAAEALTPLDAHTAKALSRWSAARGTERHLVKLAFESITRCPYWQLEMWQAADRAFDGGEFSAAQQQENEHEPCGHCADCIAAWSPMPCAYWQFAEANPSSLVKNPHNVCDRCRACDEAFAAYAERMDGEYGR